MPIRKYSINKHLRDILTDITSIKGVNHVIDVGIVPGDRVKHVYANVPPGVVIEAFYDSNKLRPDKLTVLWPIDPNPRVCLSASVGNFQFTECSMI